MPELCESSSWLVRPPDCRRSPTRCRAATRSSASCSFSWEWACSYSAGSCSQQEDSFLTVAFLSLCYFVEKDTENSSYTSIPESMWWAIQTMTSVSMSAWSIMHHVLKAHETSCTESTELLEPARGSSFSCWAFKAWLGLKANWKTQAGLGLGLTWNLESELGWGSAQT